MLYSTEEQQAEVLQQFWKQNGRTILFGVLLGVAGIFGWQYFKQYQLHQMEEQTNQYRIALNNIGRDYNEFTVRGMTEFIEQHKGDSYGAFAALNLASLAADQGRDFDLAAKYLPVAVASPDSAVSSIARIRLARVLTELGRYDQAVSTAKTVSGELYRPVISELLGDIALARGDRAGARKAYQEAYDLIRGTNDEKMNVMLKIKLDDLSDTETAAAGQKPAAPAAEQKSAEAPAAAPAAEQKSAEAPAAAPAAEQKAPEAPAAPAAEQKASEAPAAAPAAEQKAPEAPAAAPAAEHKTPEAPAAAPAAEQKPAS